MKKLFLFLTVTALLAACKNKDNESLIPRSNNKITYTATEKLSLNASNFVPEFSDHNFTLGVGTLTFPSDVTEVGENAFKDCAKMASCSLPNSVVKIGDNAFNSCYQMISFTFGSGIKEIGEMSFANCGILNVAIPKSVELISKKAFANDAGMITLSMGSGIDSIGDGAFSYCVNLTAIECAALTPPHCGKQCFEGIKANIPVSVPAASVEAYRADDEWKYFTNIKAQ